MQSSGGKGPTNSCHVVAMPFPGRGHINPMMNLCKILASRRPDVVITFVVTQEWLGYIGSDPKPDNIHFSSIPNVIPPEREKAADFPRFYEAVMTKMEDPFEQLLDRLETPVTTIIGDVELRWPTAVGNRRNIPVAVSWTMSASFYSMLLHLQIFTRNQPLSPDSENDKRVLHLALDCISKVAKANYLLLRTIQELEPETIDSLKDTFPFPVYPVGPTIPYLEFTPGSDHDLDHVKWLDSQSHESVLYISLGSFLCVSSAQMDEILSALNTSGVPFFWVARGESLRLKDKCGNKGMVVPWCDKLKVLSHSSIGGFWSLCGWNSILEALFCGVPLLAFPLFLDQVPNTSQIVNEWNNGWKIEIRVRD
ncbi:hypothetical protein K1719_010659 [Acacia pycnantha]|nr:hypothetical protein K1719_010659 [Acacia pycnantha]